MGLTSVHHNSPSIRISTLPSLQNQPIFFNNNPPSNLTLPRVPLRRCTLSLARRRSSSDRPSSSTKNKSHNKGGSKKDNDEDEDAFEALFKQLEEDLKKDGEFIDDGEEDISEDDLALLHRELGEALAVDKDLSELLNMDTNDPMVVEAGSEVGVVEEDVVDDEDGADYDDEEEEDDDDDDDEEEEDDDDKEAQEPIQLKGWQLRRLANALKAGRRKISIKKLAADLCLDRAIVLQLLREPPPNLLMLCAALPDKQEPAITNSNSETIPSVPDKQEPTSMNSNSETIPSVPSEEIIESAEPGPTIETPIHALQESWSARKRLKKVQVETLENVYRRTKRPTNAMISSIVHVTNLPRRRVVKWFEDKRTADGVPEEHRPYRRSASESVFAK